LSLKDVEQGGQASPADLVEILPHGGKGWAEVLGLGNVVKTHHADVMWHSYATLMQEKQQSKRLLIIRAEHGGNVWSRGQLAPGFIA
jgi:hypothetical protein